MSVQRLTDGPALAPGAAAPGSKKGMPFFQRPILYLILLALYMALFWDGLLPPSAREGEVYEAPAPRVGRTLEDVLRHPREVPFGTAAAVMVPLIVGSGLMVGYVILRAHNIVVFPAREFPVVPWTGWHLLRVIIALFVILRAVGVGMAWLLDAQETSAFWCRIPDGMLLIMASNISMLALCGFILCLVGWRDGNPLRLLGLGETRLWRRVGMGAVCYLMTFPVLFIAGVLMFILGPKMGIPARPQEVLAQVALLSPAAFGFVLFSAVVVTPMTEEIVFRGFVYATLRRSLGPLAAIALSAAAFAAMHAYAFGLLPLFVIGFLLAYLYERTGSLWASVTAHAANNLYALLITYFVLHQGAP
ncbi:MAG TPA: CPBP family intramembrane metalloprotease [Planctomycetota bacterium]|nr:CPBP family intramembrane metalloprotease [Planctomycetota bacterium]HRR81420.1 CPBP family intramembrane metalloprotease [Planctomycetota bacterium]HRT94821.1 CPBP family intramembrane metalloprotease [Planctomycetota bacterium]